MRTLEPERAQIYWSSYQKTFYFSRADAGNALPAGVTIYFTLNPSGCSFQDTEGNCLDTYKFSFSIETPIEDKAMPWIPLLLLDE